MMENNKSKRIYSKIGDSRLLDIRVLFDNELIYEGMVEDAPPEIKSLRYSQIDIKDKITFHTYSEFNT